MDVGSALRVLLRRWLVVLIGAALTLGAAAYLYTSMTPTYRATARVLLLLPSDAQDPESVGSPYLYLPNGLNVLARVVAAAPLSAGFAEEMEAQGFASTFEVGVDPGSPILSVGVEGSDPDNVLATRDGVVAALESELARVQEEEGVPDRQTARARVFGDEDTPATLSGNRTRGALAVVAAGGLLTLLSAFALDWLISTRRTRSRHRSTALPPQVGQEPPHEAAPEAPAESAPTGPDAGPADDTTEVEPVSQRS